MNPNQTLTDANKTSRVGGEHCCCRHSRRASLHNLLNINSAQLSPMLQSVNINLSGTGQVDGRCISCLRISGGVVISHRASCGNYRTLANVKITPKQCASRGISFICKANYNGQRINPDFNWHHSQEFSERNDWKNAEEDNTENLEHSGSVTDGLMNSLTSTPRLKVSETPGPREQEIVDIFRKIQAQLQERSTFKEQKKMESMRGKFQEKGTVDTLLKLLRRNSTEKGARNMNGNANSEFNIENHSVQKGVPNGFKNTGFSNASNQASYESKDPNVSSSTRPVSYFRRSSPISLAKNPSPTNRRRSATDCKPYIRDKSAASPLKPARELVHELATDPALSHELKSDLSHIETSAIHEVPREEFSNIDSEVDTEEEQEVLEVEDQIENGDLSSLKVADLRIIARSHGVKGYSKLKKSELVELLSKS